MDSAAYKFANQVLPLMLADAAQGAPAQAGYSRPGAVGQLPQGPTAASSAGIQPPAALPEHDLAAAPVAQKAASFEAALVSFATCKLQEKEANLAAFGRAAANFGRGALSLAKPVVGAVRGGLPGAGRGVVNAAKTIYKGGPAAAAGAAAAGYGLSQVVRSPIVMDGEGFRVQSPVRIPAVRMRSPVVPANNGNWGSGFRVQTPWKTLW